MQCIAMNSRNKSKKSCGDSMVHFSGKINQERQSMEARTINEFLYANNRKYPK